MMQTDAAKRRMGQLAALAQEHELRVAVAESLTSGLLASNIGAGDNAAEWFAGGVVAYQRQSKEHVLGVPPGIDLCSPECAETMAQGVRGLFEADLAVSTTGVGGPDADGGHPPGTVYIGWATAQGQGHEHHRFDGEPEEVLAHTAAAAVELLCRLIAARAPNRGRPQPAGAPPG